MEQLTRRITPIMLFMLSVNAIIGSGWLFAPLYAAKIAGPAAILSWIIGGSAAILISFTFAELSTMLPVAGGTAHIPQLSHGTLASFLLSWIAWISSLLMTPIEVQAVLQYASLFYPVLVTPNVTGALVLSPVGLVTAAVLMFLLCFINIVSYRGLMRFNFILFVFKFSVICFTIFAIINAKFTLANFHGITNSIHTSVGWHAIFSAVATGGIVLAFNGFKSGVELAGETKRLAIAIPISTAGAVTACLLLYIGLQIAFIGALDSHVIAHGWQHISFTGDAGPFVALAGAIGLMLLYKLLYANSIISPLGAGLIYVTSTARILYAMSKIGYVPAFLSRLNKQHLPIWAIIVNFGLSMISFLPFPGWQSMVNFLVSAMVITYAMGPVALMCLRLTLPETERPFRLPFANVICFTAFYCCNLFSYWTGWDTVSKLAIMLMVGLIIFISSCIRGYIKLSNEEFRSAFWMLPYLTGLILISYLGSFGGKGIIPFGWDFIVIGIFSAITLTIAIKSRALIKKEEVAEYLFSESIALKHH